MNTFPLVRTKWSNEHAMAALFGVSILYLLPRWIHNQREIVGFVAVLLLGLTIDVIVNFIRYKRPVCAVSAAVTATLLEVLTPGVPLLGRLFGITFALFVGKHLWGGTGKNGVNPAIVGLLFVSLLFPMHMIFHPTLLLLPALMLSLPFIMYRPFAASGFMLGMALSLMYRQEFTAYNIVASGVFFFGCLVMTDPVTVTPHPVLGAIGGFLSSLLPQALFGSVFAMAFGVLVFNVVSFVAEHSFITNSYLNHSPLRIKRVVPFSTKSTVFHDLRGSVDKRVEGIHNLSQTEFLKCIRKNEVYGFGGAAFPTNDKIKAVIDAKTPEKHLIINGVECDPGLIHDKWLLHRYPEEIYKGIKLLQEQIQFRTVAIAVKEVEGLAFPPELRICKISDYYPAGAEKVLIKEILGKTLPIEAIPAKEGVLVLNVQTVYAIYQAISMDEKSDTRFLTVADIRENTGAVVRVKLGDNVHGILKAVYPAALKFNVFCGGGVMQCHNASDDEIVDKTVNFIALSEYPRYKESPNCSGCGLCASHCPAGLKVNRIAALVNDNKGDFGRLSKYYAERCMNCGACSFICPAGRNLSSLVKKAGHREISS